METAWSALRMREFSLRCWSAVLNGLLLHRAEGSQSHMESHIAQVHTLGLKFPQQLRRKREPCRGGVAAYREAVKERYRFFSFGDAMFIS